MKHVDVIFIGRIESRLLRGQSSSVERCFEHENKEAKLIIKQETDPTNGTFSVFFIIRIIELLGLFF